MLLRAGPLAREAVAVDHSAGMLAVARANAARAGLSHARFEQAGRTFALMERIRGWCEAGLCRPHVDRTFRLDQAAEAMRALLERSVTGRVAIAL